MNAQKMQAEVDESHINEIKLLEQVEQVLFIFVFTLFTDVTFFFL